MAPSKKWKEMKSILDLHENIFHKIFQFLDNDTIYFKLRGVCRTMRIYADSFIQLGGVFMFLGQQSSQLLHMYKRKQNTVFDGIPSMKPYPASNAIKNGDAFWGVFNDRVVVGSMMRSKKGLWTQCLSEKRLHMHKKKVYWPCELMLQTLYEYDRKQRQWIKFNEIDRSSPRNDIYVPYDQHFRIMWYPIGNVCIIFSINNNISCEHLTSSKCLKSSSPACFPDPLMVIKQDYHCISLYDVNLNQSFKYLSDNHDLCSYLDIPDEISTLRDFGIVRVAPNVVIVVGGHNNSVPNSWLWQGKLTNEGSLINWTRKYNVEPMRCFNSGYPFSLKLGEDLYFIGYDRNFNVQPDGTKKKTNQLVNYIYCDRYNLKEGEYTLDVHSVPSSFSFGPKIVLKDNQETLALMTDRPNLDWTFLFTAEKGFDESPKIIGTKTILLDHLFCPLYNPYILIKIL